ncbi:DUF4198 domain-containing protein [Jannaschia formosa]|uniref:DUF4198 domain-containing protein n=1 Tax=Jannaschia formosa TaxID=2259592 RepID=UPI000E1B7697|nr:DUF4198 domain-containing protein [Jannaschia formosa]TFL18027.1 DUF4198 domain-containing protein [Jannaschia formosa]
MTVLSKTFAALCIFTLPLQAHEFWIEAEDYTVPPGGTVTATFRNGELLSGSALSYIPNRSARFDYIADKPAAPVPARLGDNPAVVLEDLPEGLVTLIHETREQYVTYTEWAKWVKFTDHKDFAWGQQAHLDRGLPEEGFREGYYRFAKALVAVGEGAGADAVRGLRAEIVLGRNPYVDDLSDGLPVQVLFDGAPKAAAQIEMFEKDAEGAVEVTLHTADAEGSAVLPVAPGHEYLLDSVTLLPQEPVEARDPVWLTFWAALTFAVPER